MGVLRIRPAFVVASLVGITLFSAMIWYVSPRGVLDVLGNVNWHYLALAWAVTLIATVFRTLRYALFMPVSHSPLLAYSVFSLSRLINVALPFRTGELATLAVLKRAKLAPAIATTVPSWFVIRVTDVFAVSMWFLLITGTALGNNNYIVVGVLALFVSAAFLLLLQNAHMLVPTSWIGREGNWLSGRIAAVIGGLSHIRSLKKKLLAVGLSLLIWAVLIASLILTQYAFLTPLVPTEAALVSILVMGITLLPVNAPMGIGTGDALWSSVLVFVGLPIHEAVPLALGIRFAIISITVLEGAIGFLLFRSLTQKSSRQ